MPHPAASARPGGRLPHAWDSYLHGGSVLRKLIASAYRPLTRFTRNGAPIFVPADAEEVVFEHRSRPAPALTLRTIRNLRELPTRGRNRILVARHLGFRTLHIRCFDAEGRRAYDGPLPDSVEIRDLKEVLEPLWTRSRLFKRERAKIVRLICELTPIVPQTNFERLFARWKPAFSPCQFERFYFKSVRRFAVEWAIEECLHRGIPLDQVLVFGEDEKGLTLHDILADPHASSAAEFAIKDNEESAIRQAVFALPLRFRMAMKLILKGVELGTSAPSLLHGAGRRTSHEAREAFGLLHSLYTQTEDTPGREFVALLAGAVVDKRQEQQLLLEHFCAGKELTVLQKEGDSMENVRRRLLRSCENLRAPLDSDILEALKLLPAAARYPLQSILESRLNEGDTALLLKCPLKEVHEELRQTLKPLYLIWNQRKRASSSTGRRYLKRDLENHLDGTRREVVRETLLEGTPYWMTARKLKLEESELKEILLDSLWILDSSR